MSRMKKDWGKNLALALVSVTVTLLLIEGFLVWIGPAQLQNDRYNNYFNVFQWTQGNTRFDAELGYINEPDLDVPFENPEFSTRVRTNSQGFRDDESSLKEPEIILLGDSFGFGWGVEDNETAGSILEKESGKRVLNLSISGYGTIQQFLLLRRFCEANDIRDCTIVFMYYVNDKLENCWPPGSVIPTVRKESRHLVFTPADELVYDGFVQSYAPCMATRISRRSTVFDLMIGHLFNPRNIWIRDLADKTIRSNEDGEIYPGIPIGPMEVFEFLLRVVSLYAEERNLEPKVVFLPFYEYFTGNRWNQDYQQEVQVLRMVEMPYRDLTDEFSESDFFPGDRHLNKEGQKKLGEGLAHFLKDS